MDISKLKEIGLTDSEVKIYLALLRLGQAKSGALTKETKLHKSRVYECLNRLIDKGLVSYVTKDFIKYFSATSPERIIDYLEERKKEIDAQKENMKSLIFELTKSMNFKEENVETFVFQGKEGLKTIHSDILKHANEIFYIGAKAKVLTEIKYFFENYDKQRVKKGISQKVLCSPELKEDIIKKLALTKYKKLSKNWKSKNVIYLYADKVINVIWEKEPIAIMIKSSEVVKFYKFIFEELWKTAKS